MDTEEIEYFRHFKREERRDSIPSLIKNLEERSLGFLKKNVTSREYRELLAEEILIEKEKYDELQCEMPGMPRSTFLMVFSPDGTKVASTHGNHNIYITDIRTGKNLKTLIGHPRTPWCIAFHPTSNQIVASGCLGGQVRIWDLSGGSEVWTATNQTVIASIAFHPIERILVIATSNEVYFWDWSQPEPFLHTSTGSHKEKVRYVSFDKLGHRLITGISNNHSRWEYVRSSERAYEPPMRHFNISSRRPVLRRGLFSGRQSVSLAPSATVPRETQSRVPERERNITISYRNLVRQYGRLVQRYLQLYRPPAMIDRGTDPMENNSELQESNSSNTTLNTPEANNSINTINSQESNDSAGIPDVNSANSTTPVQDPSIDNAAESQESDILGDAASLNDAADLLEPSISNNTVELLEPNSISINTADSNDSSVSDNVANLTKPSISNETVDDHDLNVSSETADFQGTNHSNDMVDMQQPDVSNDTENFQGPNSSEYITHLPESNNSNTFNSISSSLQEDVTSQPSSSNSNVPSSTRKHKNESATPSNIPRKKIKKTRSDHGAYSESRSESPQPSTSGLSNQPSNPATCCESEMNVNASGSQDDQRVDVTGPSDELNVHIDNLETDNGETNIQTEELTSDTSELNVLNNQENNSSENQRENTTGNIRNNRESNTQTESPRGNQFSSSLDDNDSRFTSRDDDARFNDNRPERRGYTRIFRRLIRSRPLFDIESGRNSPEYETEHSRMRSIGPATSLDDDNFTVTHGVGTEREVGENQRLENMMMNMRRNAEENLRARFMPVIRSRVPENDREELISVTEGTQSSPPNPVGNTSTGTTNSTSYSQARRRLGPAQNQQSQDIGIRPLSSPTVINNFPRDEVINFSELPNSEDDAPERTEPATDTFHPFNPPPNLPAINPENIGIGNMYSNIVHDLETSLNNARDTRTVDRPGEMSSMLSTFSNRLETLMNQSEGILRNLRTSVDVLPDNDPLEYGEEARVPTASFNDSTFFVRDQRTDRGSPGRNFNDAVDYEIHQNNVTSDHTYPRNSESASTSSNMNETMSPLMSSLHLTLSHIQSQSRLLHRQVECIERIDRAMVEVAQLQLMRILLVELSTYVRNLSGESRSTSMTSVRQMMAGTRISDSSPGDIQSNRTDEDNPIYDPGPSTSSGSGSTAQSSSARSRGLTRKTYPPSRLNRPREAGGPRSTRNTQDQRSSTNPSVLPSVAPPHAYSEITLFTLIRMDRRLQSLIDDHSMRFSYLNEHFSSYGTRRLFHEVGEHNLALRLRESITRTNRLLGNIFNANIVRNYRIDSSTSLRHGIERYYERTLLSLIIDGISSHLDENRNSRVPDEFRTRMQNVLQLAMMLSDLLLLYTINSLSPTTDVNLDTERTILAMRVSENCSTMIQCRQYRNFSNIFVQSLRNLRLMVSTFSINNHIRAANRRREYIRQHISSPPFLMRGLDEPSDIFDNDQASPRGSNENTARESNTGPNETRSREASNTRNRGSVGTRSRESANARNGTSGDSNNSPLINACLYLARRQREHQQANSRGVPRDLMSHYIRNIFRVNRNRASTQNTNTQNERPPQPEPSTSSQNTETNVSLNESHGSSRTRRRNSTDLHINAYLTAGRNRNQNQELSNENQVLSNENRVSSNETPETNSPQNVNETSSVETRTDPSSGHSTYGSFRPTNSTTRDSYSRNQNVINRNSGTRTAERPQMLRSMQSLLNARVELRNSEESLRRRLAGREQSREPQGVGSNLDINAWWENAVEELTSATPEQSHRTLLFGTPAYDSPMLPQLRSFSPMQMRSSTANNTSETSEASRAWRIPSVQVNDVPIELGGPSQESSESDNSPTLALHNNSTYPRVMARLAAIRSVSVYNPIGVLRPRLLHPLYATLNPFDADLEQREHIYDSDVISTVTPNHRIQVWDISDSIIPDISDPLKNLVVRECKIHNDASVDIASDGSILVTLLPSGGYLNITNRLGVYSLRWETLGQCLYTTSFVHNAVSVSLSPLGRHLVVGLASRRVSLLPNDRWMMASIFKIEEKDTPGDHLPFVRQIDRGSDERVTNHKSVNCIRWLPTSGQGLIYATNTGQLNIWT